MADSSEQHAFPSEGRLLGLDYGTRRVGVALSTREQNIASPLENYTRQGEQADADYFRRIIAEYGIVGVVVGLPVHLSGDEGEKAREARQFGAWIARVTDLPVIFWDERFTSAMAEDQLLDAGLTRKRRKERLDKLAAQIMLQSFLDAEDRGRAAESLRDPS